MRFAFRFALALLLGGALFSPAPASAQTAQVVYADALQNGWQDWSWATVNLAATSHVQAGSRSISVNAANWQAMYFAATTPIDVGVFTGLTFWVNGGSAGGQVVQVQGTTNSSGLTPVLLAPFPTNAWRQETISLASLGFAQGMDLEGFWLQVTTTNAVPQFFVDSISFSGPAAPTNPPASTSVIIRVDAAADRHVISPLIYGVNFAGSNALRELNVSLNRNGGNLTSRYNWRTNASNHAMDWYFESLPQAGSGPGATVDRFIQDSRDGQAEAMITIPINGWVAKLGPGGQRLSSFSIAKYGPQTGNDYQWFPDAGNGISSSNGQYIANNDPLDANQPSTPEYQAEWIRYLTNHWGSSAEGGVRYYLMDNEWAIWHETHRDVHPVGVTMEQSRDLFCAYASMVKSNDPAALVLGPEEFGWSGYLHSGYDLQWGNTHGWGNPLPDRTAHGGAVMMPWWLDQVRQRSEDAGKRLLDVFTLHYYPQGGEFSDTVSPAMQARRNRSTRSLWDPNYIDESWIADNVRLIPLMKSWVASNYPGTPIGITEYSWGADGHINGGTAQADVLGIFGREGVDLATRWVVPASGTPAYRAIQMYRNYDGSRSAFGDISVRATVPDPDRVSAFAAERSASGHLTVMAINKETTAAHVQVALSNFVAAGFAQVWSMTSGAAIARQPDVTFTTNLSVLLPAQSVSLLVIPRPSRLGSLSATNGAQIAVQHLGLGSSVYEVDVSPDLVSWQPATNHIQMSDWDTLVFPGSSTTRFYRTRWTP
ncbi:MAG: glycoside hydrolase family 44 protein [Kiritimatiellae bacterium]|nr:glycoside hydrolase family 44 protein [Kiritimatiellia bacterium]MCO5067686.1 glycoside hydrolase family 44 protein [Kiritimatiellia bacterium]